MYWIASVGNITFSTEFASLGRLANYIYVLILRFPFVIRKASYGYCIFLLWSEKTSYSYSVTLSISIIWLFVWKVSDALVICRDWKTIYVYWMGKFWEHCLLCWYVLTFFSSIFMLCRDFGAQSILANEPWAIYWHVQKKRWTYLLYLLSDVHIPSFMSLWGTSYQS
jgi:hypothetical protein